MQEKRNFNQTDYIREYNKQHYSSIKVQIKKEEMDELNDLLKKHNMSKAQFIRNAINDLKNKK